jgi:hypothetical protein
VDGVGSPYEDMADKDLDRWLVGNQMVGNPLVGSQEGNGGTEMVLEVLQLTMWGVQCGWVGSGVQQ